MKLWIKIFFTAVVGFLIFFVATYVFLAFEGKAIITKSLARLTGKKVTMGSFSVLPPLNIEIKDLNIEGLAKVEYICVIPSVPNLLTGRIALNDVKIIKPEITYERFAEAIIAPAAPSGAQVAVESPKVNAAALVLSRPKYPSRLRLIFRNLKIEDGKVIFIDHAAGKDGITITVKDINFGLTNLFLFPSTATTNFDLKGVIPWKEGQTQGKISFSGWLNLNNRDIEADLKIEDIDGIYLYPYYSNWVDLEKARIEKANLNFLSKIRGKDNNVSAESHLELTNIVRKPRLPEEAQEKDEKITDAVLNMFKAMDEGKVVLDFTIRTKMDRPEFGFGSIKMAFEDKIAQGRGGIKTKDVLSFPVKFLQNTVSSASDVSKAMIDGILAIGKEVKKDVEGTIKKKSF